MASGGARGGSWGRTGRGLGAGILLWLSLLTAAAGPAVAGVEVSRSLDALAREIGAAQAHAAVLRERLATAVEPSDGADIAGIANGGVGSSLASLRLVARALDRRVERLRLATAGELPADRAEVMLALRASLADFRWTVETMGQGRERDSANAAPSDSNLLRLDESLRELDLATAAIARFDWAE